MGITEFLKKYIETKSDQTNFSRNFRDSHDKDTTFKMCNIIQIVKLALHRVNMVILSKYNAEVQSM